MNLKIALFNPNVHFLKNHFCTHFFHRISLQMFERKLSNWVLKNDTQMQFYFMEKSQRWQKRKPHLYCEHLDCECKSETSATLFFCVRTFIRLLINGGSWIWLCITCLINGSSADQWRMCGCCTPFRVCAGCWSLIFYESNKKKMTTWKFTARTTKKNDCVTANFGLDVMMK